MSTSRLPLLWILLGLLTSLEVTLAAERKTLRGHVPEAVAGAVPIGRVTGTRELRLAIGVPLRDPAGLEKFLADVYDPASPNYRHFLSPEEFAGRFSASEAEYAGVKEFARSNGFAIAGEHNSRLLLDVVAATTDIERAFHIRLCTFQHPTEAREFFAPDAEPSVEAALAVVDVQGLSDFGRPHPLSRRRAAGAPSPRSGTAPDGSSYFGNDFRSAYAPGVALTGAGQAVGLFQVDGFYAADIAKYAQQAGGGRTNILIQTVLLDGFSGIPTTGANSGNGEVSLDIEMAMSMAPGLSRIVVFEGNPSTGNFFPNDILNAMAASNTVKNLSSSWGWTGGPDTTTGAIFQKMSAQGQSFFTASGDSDAFTVGATSANGADNPSKYNTPSSCPYITVVGGTTLTMNGSGGSYASETAWNWGLNNNEYVGTSGGVSSWYSIPFWQQGLSMTANLGSTTQRNIPDVALTADEVYVYYSNGSSGVFGGTSCAAPLWAGFMALVNQQIAINTGSAANSAGFVNPALYCIGRGLNPGYSYADCFHDTTSGNNFWSSSPTNYPAVAGYDLCTGWGTPNGQTLINALADQPDVLAVTPAAGFAASGVPAGPLSPSSVVFTLTNSGPSPLSWSASSTESWLVISTTASTLAPSGQTNVTVQLATDANGFAIGSYFAMVVFSNQVTGTVRNRLFTLDVASRNVVLNGGFEAGDFTAWDLTGTPNTSFNTYNAVVNRTSFRKGAATNYIHSGSYGAYLSDNIVAVLAQDLSTVPGQNYVLSFWLRNPTAGSGQQFLVNWNTNGVTTNRVFYLNNPPALAWTNVTLLLRATSTNTTLQFGAMNQSGAFGLDDISVTPVNLPSIVRQPASQTNISGNTAVFAATAGGSPGLVYQWRKNGTNLANGGNISGALSNVLTLGSVTAGDAANYALVVTNPYGSVTSALASLTVLALEGAPPGIAGNLTNRTLECGANTNVFSLVVTGTPPLSVQWQLDGVPVGGATNTTFALTNLLFPSRTVAVIVTNLYGSSSSNALLTLMDTRPPAITLLGANPLTNELGAAFTDSGALASDACAGVLPIAATGFVNTNLTGAYTLIYAAADPSGNSNSVTRAVVVRDTRPPAIQWSFTNLVLAANSNCVALMPDVTGTNLILATDASGELTITQNPTNNAVLPLGTNEVVITIADASSNASSVTNHILVVDLTPPVITLNGANPMFASLGVAFTDPGAAADDNCMGVALFTTNGVVNIGAVGTNLLVYWAADGAGNTNSVSRTVLVFDPMPIITSVASAGDAMNLSLAGAPNRTYLLLGTTNLEAAGLWEPLVTNSPGSNGAWSFADTQVTNSPQRFYRLKLLP